MVLQLHLIPQIIVWHWQTDSHAVHVALGELYDVLGELVDRGIECVQGHMGSRVKVPTSKSLQCVNWTDVNKIDEVLTAALQITTHLSTSIDANMTDIGNILDEIAAAIAKTIYLLTLK